MNNNYENLPAVLNANQLATALGISRAGAYQLLNTRMKLQGESCWNWRCRFVKCIHFLGY